MLWFTSDHHFEHANVIKYCKRPFGDVDKMNQAMIERWNLLVEPDDQVYYLGDFALGKKVRAKEIIDQLNGHLHLVRGNHDNKDIRKLDRWEWVKDYCELNVPDEEMDLVQTIVMCHYPIESWNKRHHGSWHLHGHCHGTLGSSDHQARVDVGADLWSYAPVSYDEIKAVMTRKIFKPKIFKPIDHHMPNLLPLKSG